jgi:hypothetical protein
VVHRIGRSLKRALLVAAIGSLAAGCATRIPPPTTPADARTPDRAWAAHLRRFVDEKGRMDFAGMAESPADLETYLAWAATTGPESSPSLFPTLQDELAYYINTYNALAMYDVVKSGFPPDLYRVRVTFFYKNRFEVAGRFISLYALENQVIRPKGDPRVHVALNCMARGCPRLPRESFEGAKLDSQLDAQAREFFNEARNVELLGERQTVRFSEILRFYPEDFLKKAPSLIAYANLYRSEKIPEGWRVEYIPYDWTLNRQ